MKKNKKIIVGNWKMNPGTVQEVDHIVQGTIAQAQGLRKTEVVLCPPFIYIERIIASMSKKGNVAVGAQNIYTELKGSFTGEIAAPMISGLGATYSITGHSERRKMGETDEVINKKILLALKSKLIPIICIGETTRDDDGAYLGFIKDQIVAALKGVSKANLENIIIAYEPVWAIGASAAMDAHDVHQMSIFITKALMDIYKAKTSLSVPLLYGGSVDPTNTLSIIKEGNVDGLLVGRQSLDPESFGEILRIANSV